MTINEKVGKSKTVTICGSMKFWDEIIEIGSILERMGNVVFVPVRDPRPADQITEDDRTMYSVAHNKKIKNSDCIYVVNIGGYVGKSTSKEIEFSRKHGKQIIFHEPGKQRPRIVTLIGSSRFKEIFDIKAKEGAANGEIVFIPEIFRWDDTSTITPIQHERLDFLHHRKMLMADEIIVVNGSGHIGEDTMEEINFALDHNLNIRLLFPEYNQGVLKR